MIHVLTLVRCVGAFFNGVCVCVLFCLCGQNIDVKVTFVFCSCWSLLACDFTVDTFIRKLPV